LDQIADGQPPQKHQHHFKRRNPLPHPSYLLKLPRRRRNHLPNRRTHRSNITVYWWPQN